ncbi:hypothetical protein FOXB_13413 [Fusarium oxysporum f. sp. conglutinans Fo5176]|uniref:Chromo domain-containing protein n=1 Tax=Fusarium oxysporum (strain Fo5176) TaxID=660025 RepID=F9G431_FUSOF|nr:hypothetical protein FOXB_13413 [Fusarium oxysporum f. sp. conglutinans Fo5176]
MSSSKRLNGRKPQKPDELVEKALLDGLSWDRSQVDPHIVRRYLGKLSVERYDHELRLWEAYKKRFPESTPHDIKSLKHFAEFLGRTVDIKRSMAPYIDGELAEKLSLLKGKKGQRKKAFITFENYVHLHNRLWINDFHDYVHEGSRVNNANLINKHCYTSARCQELCQARYKDLQCIVSWKDGRPEFRLKFTREICKATDKNQPEHPFAEQIVGPDGLPAPLFAQPMLHWLANMVASRAFADLDDVEQLLALKPPGNGNFRILQWADDAKEKPVFPEWASSGPKAKTKSPRSWVTQFSDWGKRAGFTAPLGLHAVRREALIRVNDNGYTLGQVLRFASQNNTNVLVNHYLGSVSTIDGAGSYLGMNLRTDLAEDFRSASVGRNPSLQFSLPAKKFEELRTSPEYLELTAMIKKTNSEIERSTLPEERARLELQRKTAYKVRSTLENRRLREYQATQKVIYETDIKGHEQTDWRQSHFDRISHVLPEERLTKKDCVQSKDAAPLLHVAKTYLYKKPTRCNRRGGGGMSIDANKSFLLETRALRNFVSYAWHDQDAWKRHVAQCFSAYLIQQRDVSTIVCSHPKCPKEFLSEKDFGIIKMISTAFFTGANQPHSSEDPRNSKRVALEKPLRIKLVHPTLTDGTTALESQPNSPYPASQDSLAKADSPYPLPDGTFEIYDEDEFRYREVSSEPPRNLASYAVDGPDMNTDEGVSTVSFIPVQRGTQIPVDPLLTWQDDNTPLCGSETRSTPTVLSEKIETEQLCINGTRKLSWHAASASWEERNKKGDEKRDTEDEDDEDDEGNEEETYQVECLLGRWGRDLFYLRWLDGSYSWEPRENILDEELLQEFEKGYRGFKDGVTVLRTRLKNGKVDYRLHWEGRPKSEDWWTSRTLQELEHRLTRQQAKVYCQQAKTY